MGWLDYLGNALGSAVSKVLAPAVSAVREQSLRDFEQLYYGEQYKGQGLSPSWDKIPPGVKAPPLRRQEPSVQYDLPRLIVDRPTALLFGEGRAPDLVFESDTQVDVSEVNAWLSRVAEESQLYSKLLVWARLACTTGSGCITWAVVDGELEFQPRKSQHCYPTFDPRRPGRLIALEIRYKFCREELDTTDDGRSVIRSVEYWHREQYTDALHIVFKPSRVSVGLPKEVFEELQHGLGRVPAVWVKPIDDAEPASPDGMSLLDGLEDLFKDIDYTLTQKSRALRYNLEPERAYYGLSEEERERIRQGGPVPTLLRAKTEGTAVELIEMASEPQRAADEHVTSQRSRALETARIVSPDPDKLLAAARSGAALRILHGSMLEMVGELRAPFGAALRDLLNQVITALRDNKIALTTSRPPAVIPTGSVKLQWGKFFDPTPEDLQLVASIAQNLKASGVVDCETVTRWLCGWFGFRDVESILAKLESKKSEEPEETMETKTESTDSSDTQPPATDDTATSDGVVVPNVTAEATGSAQDAKAQGAAAAQGKLPEIFGYHIDAGVLTVDEVRSRLGFPALPDGRGQVSTLQWKTAEAAQQTDLPGGQPVDTNTDQRTDNGSTNS